VDIAGDTFEAITDDAGAFTLAGLRAGRYYLSVTKPGMVTVAYGAKRPEGMGSAVVLADGQKITGLALRMSRGAVITGAVRDATGEPARGVRVNAMRIRPVWSTGERVLQPASSGLGEETDDRGQYRIFGLPPGEYAVLVTMGLGSGRGGTDVYQTTGADVQWATRQIQDAARTNTGLTLPPQGPNVDYAPVFYPGTAVQANAEMIKLSAGEERSGVDIPLARVPTAKIEGTITSADGPVPANLQVNVMAHERIVGLPFAGFSSVPQVRDGKFTLSGLLPGGYTILVRPRPTPGPPGRAGAPGPAASVPELFAIEPVTLSGSDVAVTLTLRSGVTVSGRLVFDGTTLPPPADLARIRVSLSAVVTGSAVALGASPATVDAGGTFAIRGVAPGRYRLGASVPGSAPGTGWQVRHAMVNGRDALDVPFDVGATDVGEFVVTFTDRPTELSGTIQDPAGQPAPEYVIVVFARDKSFWTPGSRRIQSSRPGHDGRFIFRSLPPGEYGIAAVTDIEQGEWNDPSFLAKLLSASVAITLAEGEKKVQDMRVTKRPD
jgi:uncharacterized protein (DUF2141 family)